MRNVGALLARGRGERPIGKLADCTEVRTLVAGWSPGQTLRPGDSVFDTPDSEGNPVVWARGRQPERTYIYKSFPAKYGRDAGHPARYVYKVFDERTSDDETADDWDRTTVVVSTSPGGRKQIRLEIARHAGAVREITIQRVPTNPVAVEVETILKLDREQSGRLIELFRTLDSIPAEGTESFRLDDQLLRDVLADPTAVRRAYATDPEQFRSVIENDGDARDVIALQHRRDVVQTMRAWLEDGDAFDDAASAAGGPEKAWQQLLEANPWILGIGLGGQLFSSWDSEKLEKVVAGSDIKTAGKRVDALLRTSGIVQALAFAEIKHHRTELLAARPYRPGVWQTSSELAGAVAQVQQTVRMAVRDLGEYVEDVADDGSRMGTGTFIVQPRSYLIVGSLVQLLGAAGGTNDEKVTSFELFRRNTHEPEVITFDELLARAEWHVRVSESEVGHDS